MFISKKILYAIYEIKRKNDQKKRLSNARGLSKSSLSFKLKNLKIKSTSMGRN